METIDICEKEKKKTDISEKKMIDTLNQLLTEDFKEEEIFFSTEEKNYVISIEKKETEETREVYVIVKKDKRSFIHFVAQEEMKTENRNREYLFFQNLYSSDKIYKTFDKEGRRTGVYREKYYGFEKILFQEEDVKKVTYKNHDYLFEKNKMITHDHNRTYFFDFQQLESGLWNQGQKPVLLDQIIKERENFLGRVKWPISNVLEMKEALEEVYEYALFDFPIEFNFSKDELIEISDQMNQWFHYEKENQCPVKRKIKS